MPRRRAPNPINPSVQPLQEGEMPLFVIYARKSSDESSEKQMILENKTNAFTLNNKKNDRIFTSFAQMVSTSQSFLIQPKLIY